ncbi:MAG: histidinol dehydrogenase [Acidobacteria bacterium]|nr:histidinol dehydrogenase [Acidobacteriota bacterium]
MLRILRSSDRAAIDALFARRSARLEEAEAVVRPILAAVRERGDAALVEYARKFDRLEGDSVRIPAEELSRQADAVTPALRSAVETAAGQIRAFAERQAPRGWMDEIGPGIRLGQIVRPLDAVGAYIPGGRYPLPSTLMMTVIPAQVAGVGTISACCPGPTPETLATAGLLGVKNFFRMGGAQAIAAFCYGTETVPRAQRIVGPGNIYVAAAKKLLAGDVGIDFVAGPTEILLIFPDGDPRKLAADMLAQAEHDVDAAAILLTMSAETAERTAAEVERQLETLPTAAVARRAIDDNSAIVICDSVAEACAISNDFAPEHLSVADDSFLDQIVHAGSVFVGPWSPEAAGDYASGPNHVLPTSGAARLRGGLSILDYVKIITVQQLEPAGLERIASAVTTLARAEGLEAHARSVEARFD